MKNKPYYKYSDYLLDTYGEKAYKITLNINSTCPNLDGKIGHGGCAYCGDGAGHEKLVGRESIVAQLLDTMESVRKKYKANKFIAYYQNYSNTYMPLEKFKEILEATIHPEVVEVSIATRPDCLGDNHLEILKEFSQRTGVNITIELGLQTVNYKILEKINRGHTLAEYIMSANKIKAYGFRLCTHVILNLPESDMSDVIETAKILTVLKSDYVKLHALMIVKNSIYEKMYEKGKIELVTYEDYKERVKTFLEHIDENMAVQRIIGRAPQGDTLFANWSMSWWKIHDEIVAEMLGSDRSQGTRVDYLKPIEY